MSLKTREVSFSNPFRRFVRTEDGALTWFGLYMFATMCVVAGIAVDVSFLITARTQLQVAADIAAHAALLQRDRSDISADDAKQKALEMAQSAMPPWFYGDVITVEDIKFGTYDPDTFTFTEDNGSREAAKVEAFRVSDRANTVGSFFLRFIGKDEWDMVVPSVFETYRPTCFREGFVANDVVDVQSNNTYGNGFCIHSNRYVSINSNNEFQTGTIVSMPNIDNLDLPRSGFETNAGLYEARRPGKYRMHILSRTDDILDGMTDSTSRYFRSDYVTTDSAVYPTLKNKMAVGDFQANRVNIITCGAQGVTLESGTYANMVIIGRGCNFSLQNGVRLESMTLITTSTDDRSIDSPQGLVLGRDDNCAEGGGAEIITWGGVRVAAALEMYGSQILAHGPVYFQANANGIEGASIVSGSWIDGNSNTSFAFCGTGMSNAFQAEYFRMRG